MTDPAFIFVYGTLRKAFNHPMHHRIDETEPLLSLLDDYEECSPDFPVPHEYLRKPVQVHLSTGGSVSAWCYVYQHSIRDQQLIKSGDYIAFSLNSP